MMFAIVYIIVFYLFVDAFSNLKKSEFYQSPETLVTNKASSGPSSKAVRPSTSKSNPILVSPRQVSFIIKYVIFGI